MPDISLVGVRLVVEGTEEGVAKLGAFDAAAKASTASLKEMGGDNVHAGLSRLIVSVENTGKSMDQASGHSKSFMSSLKDLDGTLSGVSSSLMHFTAYGIGGAALGFAGLSVAAATFGVKAAAGFEQTRISFETMLGSVSAGDQLFKNLQAFNYKTPFGLPDLTHSAQTLLQYGFNADNVMPVIKTLTNVASAAPAGEGSADLERSALAIGQINAAGVVRGQDINQLTQAGFPIIKLLQQVTGMTGPALQHQLQGGGLTLPASTLMAAIAKGDGSVLSPYQNAAEKQSASLTGQFSNFTDSFRQSAADASQPLADSLAKNMQPLTDSLHNLLGIAMPPINQFFTVVAEKLPGALASAGPGLQKFFDGLQHNGPMILGFFHDLGMLIPDLLKVGGVMLPILDHLATAFHDLLNLPYGIGTVGVTGLLTGLLAYNALSGPIGLTLKMAEALDILTSAKVRNETGAVFGKNAGKFGKGLGIAAGAVGVGASAYDAAQNGPSVGNVLGGAASGALTGAAVGSIFPVVGTAVGAAAGGIIGGAGAYIIGETQHHVTIQVNGANPADTTAAIDQYYRDVNRRVGSPATP